MYESPISEMLGEIQTKIIEQQENRVLQAVQNCGINVDKEELIKALMYDRQQYEKGYADAKAEMRWIPCSERLPERRRSVLVYERIYKNIYTAYYDSAYGWMTFNPCRDECFPEHLDIIAWMPLPASYTQE